MIRAIAILLLMAVNGWSAEFLIMARGDKPDQLGEIVEVFPDGKLSDYAHAGGKFYVIRVSGLSYATALKYHDRIKETVTVNGVTSIVTRGRIYRLRISDLPTKVKNQLKTTYVYNTTLTAVKNYIRNNVTGVSGE